MELGGRGLLQLSISASQLVILPRHLSSSSMNSFLSSPPTFRPCLTSLSAGGTLQRD